MNDESHDHSKDEEKLEAAINEYLAATHRKDGLLVDWFLLCAQHIVNDDSTTSTSFSTCAPHDQPLYRAMGMLDYGRSILDMHFMDDD